MRKKDSVGFDLACLVDTFGTALAKNKGYRSEISPAELLERYNNA